MRNDPSVAVQVDQSDSSFDLDDLLVNVKAIQAEEQQDEAQKSLNIARGGIQDILNNFQNATLKHFTYEKLEELTKEIDRLAEVSSLVDDEQKTIKTQLQYWYQTIFIGQLTLAFSTRTDADRYILALLHLMQQGESEQFSRIRCGKFIRHLNAITMLVVREPGKKSPIELYKEKYLFYALEEGQGFFVLAFDGEKDRHAAQEMIRRWFLENLTVSGRKRSAPVLPMTLTLAKRRICPVGVEEVSIISKRECAEIEKDQEFIQSEKNKWATVISDEQLSSLIMCDLDKSIQEIMFLLRRYAKNNQKNCEECILQLKNLDQRLRAHFGFNDDWEREIQLRVEKKETYRITADQLMMGGYNYDYGYLPPSYVSHLRSQPSAPPMIFQQMRAGCDALLSLQQTKIPVWGPFFQFQQAGAMHVSDLQFQQPSNVPQVRVGHVAVPRLEQPVNVPQVRVGHVAVPRLEQPVDVLQVRVGLPTKNNIRMFQSEQAGSGVVTQAWSASLNPSVQPSYRRQ